MRILSKVPSRLPDEPVLIREAWKSYAIWTGRNWHGSLQGGVGRFWSVTTPSSPSDVIESKKAAIAEAYSRALRAEGK